VRVSALTRGMVRCPDHAEELTPAQARSLAVELITWADAAEGWCGRAGFVTRADMLAELAILREEVDDLRRGR
jgi:hypothetical protein